MIYYKSLEREYDKKIFTIICFAIDIATHRL